MGTCQVVCMCAPVASTCWALACYMPAKYSCWANLTSLCDIRAKSKGKEKKHHVLLFRYTNSTLLPHPCPLSSDNTSPSGFSIEKIFRPFRVTECFLKNK